MSELLTLPGIITIDEYETIVESGDIERVKSIHKNPKTVVKSYSDDFNNETKVIVLDSAIYKNNLEMVQTLVELDREFYVNAIPQCGLIDTAVRFSNPSMVRYLMQYKPDVRVINEQSESFHTIFQTAINTDNLEMVDTLLDSGWDIHWNIFDIIKMVEKFGFEKSIRVFERVDPSRIPERDQYERCRGYIHLIEELLEIQTNDEIFTWIMNHGWPIPTIKNRFDHYIFDEVEIILSNDNLDIILARDLSQGQEEGNQWWRDNYDLTYLSILAEWARDENDPERKRKLQRYVESFMSSVQCREEQAIIDKLVIDFPEYEVLERSFPL